AVYDDALGALDRPRVRVTALGFSQGCATVCRWAAATSRPLDRLVLWAGPLPPELVPASGLFGKANLVLVAGRSDRQVSAASVERQAVRLREAGLDCELHLYDGGHDMAAAPLRALADAREAT